MTWRSEELLVIIVAVLVAVIIGLTLGLGTGPFVIWVICAALLAGGVMFTFFEVRRLAARAGYQNSVNQSDVDLEDIHRAGRAARLRILASLRRMLTGPGPTNEPYPHHENHPESPGLDQGQLTSHWPSTTPILEDLAKSSQKHDPNSAAN